MVCLPLYGLYNQLMLIKRQKSTGSFSIYITAILILANLLKIFFWFSVGFALSMLIQSAFILALNVPFPPSSYCSSMNVSS